MASGSGFKGRMSSDKACNGKMMSDLALLMLVSVDCLQGWATLNPFLVSRPKPDQPSTMTLLQPKPQRASNESNACAGRHELPCKLQQL